MTQTQLVVLALKVVLIGGVLSCATWIAVYTKMAPWWRNPIGRTLVIKTSLIMLLFVPSILSLFFHFTRVTSWVAAWLDVAVIGAITPVMIWRTFVWRKVVAAKREDAV